MRYILKDKYILRGWTDLTYALVNTQNGETEALNSIVFQVLSFCNGTMDFDSPLTPTFYHDILEHLLKNKVIVKATDSQVTNDYQSYHLFPCRRVKLAQWSITGKCNYKCRHCYMSAPDAKYGELTLKECLHVVDQLAEAGIFQVMLTGGEPLVRKDFFTLLDALDAKKITVTEIYSNGRLVTHALLDKLETRNLKPIFSVSFDGVGRHDWLRGIPGAEKNVIEVFELLQKRGFICDVEMSLHKLNIQTIESSVNLLASLGIRNLKITPTTESGKWTQEEGKYTLSTEELYNAYLDYIKIYRKSNAPINLMLGGFFMCSKGREDYIVPSQKYNGKETMLEKPLCGSAHQTVYIAADAKVLPCIPLSGLPIQDKFPNLLESDLTQILTHSTYAELIETRLKDLLHQNEKCARCEWKLECGGGCRAGALVTNQNYLGCDDTTCYLFKENYLAKIAEVYQSNY